MALSCDRPYPLLSLSMLASQQASAISKTDNTASQCVDYLATFPNGKAMCAKTDMAFWARSDGACLVEPKARNPAGCLFFLAYFLNNFEKRAPKLNDLMRVLYETLKNVVSSSNECEIASTLENVQDTIAMRRKLIEMGHSQPVRRVIR